MYHNVVAMVGLQIEQESAGHSILSPKAKG